MNVIYESNRVLEKLVMKFKENENAYSPVFHIVMKDFSAELNLSIQQLNLCLWILNDAEYIKTSVAYNRDENATKEIVLTPKAFTKIEKTIL